MKKYINLSLVFVFLIATSVALTGCDEDFLTAKPTESQAAGGEATEGAIRANLAAAYQILLFDSYADFNFNSIVLMSDLRSDDIYKGGADAGDQMQLYRLWQLQPTPTELPAGLWNIYYSGLARCINAIQACENAVGVEESVLEGMKAEATFLKAYYTHWLWKFWGNIPYYEDFVDQEPYMAPQLDADEVYEKIIADLDDVINSGALPMRNSPADHGKATQAAAKMLKARVVMYQNDTGRYGEVMDDMAEIINSQEFGLVDDFAEIWTREGEFGHESIFEVNHYPEGRDWGAAWTGYGTNLPRFISPAELSGADLLSGNDEFVGGWGFGPVREETANIFESGDERLAGSINHFEEGAYTPRFQDTGYFMAKYAARDNYADAPFTEDLNFENNLRLSRYAETLLNAAELIVMHGQSAGGIDAQDALDQIRARAGLGSIPATEENIKLERRREFIGEGMRFWDVVRWGDTDELFPADMIDQGRTTAWEDYMRYLPIPESEILQTSGEFRLEQNPGY